MTGELFFNGVDAYEAYGISLEETGLSALLTPPPMKSVIETKYRSKGGKSIVNKNPQYDERELTLPIHLVASSQSDFITKYSSFCNNVLKQGKLTVKTKYSTDVYSCLYLSCTQFSEFNAEYASFSLKLNEYNPSNRTGA